MTIPLLAAAACLLVPPTAERITAGDLAPRLPLFAAVPAESALAFAPAPGARRILRAAELERLAAKLRAPGAAAGKVEEDVCVERAAEPLDAARLLAAMQRSIPEARIEIREVSRYPAPAGEIEFPRAGLRPSGLWAGFVRYGRERKFRIWAQVEATVEQETVMAATALVPGRPVTAEQVRVESLRRRPGAPAARSLAEVVGRLPRRAIAKGAAVQPEWLEEAPLVGRGDPVRVEVRQGGARLELDAVAETSGRRGDRIALRNPESKKRFQARVSGKGRAVIEDPGTRRENP
jgi:flagella basal body P-ring formation protein FlgA